MTDMARATVTIPGVTPDTTGLPGKGTDIEGGGAGADDSQESRSPVSGLRSLASAPWRGGGGGGPRSRGAGPGSSGRIDVRNTWQILAGSILVPLGVVFILLGWYGAAHARVVQQQIPYMVSGSFAGLGCMILGGLLYWAHWLYRIYDQADLHHEEQLRALEQALRAVAEHTATSGSVPSGTSPAGPASAGPAPTRLGGYDPSPPTAAGGYVMTTSGSVYHLPDCPVVSHHPEGLRPLSAGGTVGLAPCRICLPGNP